MSASSFVSPKSPSTPKSKAKPTARPKFDRHADFLTRIKPAVETHAKIVFRHRDAEGLEEATQSAITMAWAAYTNLLDQSKQDRIFPSALATFSCKQVNDCRQLGGHRNSLDALSPRSQSRNGFAISELTGLPAEVRESLIDRRRTPIPDQVAFRLDLAVWLSTLSDKLRKAVRFFVEGYGTKIVAKKLKVSPSRVSQIRRELEISWARFQCEVGEVQTA